MNIRPATPADSNAIAELALIAGDGIPGFFWAESQRPGESLEETGARLLTSESANFSYRNVHVACVDNAVAAMILAYRLPSAAENDEDPLDFPEFVQPLVELEQCVPESFYINMLAAFPQYRGLGAGSALLREVGRQAHAAGCELISIEVFGSNTGATRLYQRHGFTQVESRPMVASDYHPAGEVLLLTRSVTATDG